jgi:uncharacterized membrane protein YdjX (TVP38/TMEM64 family)
MLQRRKKTKIALFAVILVVVLFLLFSAFCQQLFLGYIGAISGFFGAHGIAGIFIFIVVSFFSSILSPLSSLPLIPSAVIVWEKFFTLIFLMIGWFFGAWVGYFIGKYASEKFLSRYWNFKEIDRYKEKISPGAQFGLVLFFRFAIPSEITGITLGIIRYHLGKYLIAVFLTELPFAFASVYLSGALVQGNLRIFAGLFVFIIVLILFASYVFRKKV